jgi:hypothetical protein
MMIRQWSFSFVLSMAAALGCSGSDDAAQGDPSGSELTSNAWNWVPIDGAKCRDGSSTGIGINPNPASDKLVILLDEGGACFDATTCSLNLGHYGGPEFDAFTADRQSGGAAGMFDRSGASNPVKDWNFVFVPYCTGDVFVGNNPEGSVTGLGPQQFVGYANVALTLERAKAMFPNVTQVLLAGVSAGGFGAIANYAQVARAFEPVPVTLLDDSGPPMGPPTVSTCLANQWIQLWNVSQTVMTDCGSDCTEPAEILIGLQKHNARSYPNRSMALVDSTGDSVISMFLGFGSNDCTAFTALSPTAFAAGLEDVRSQMAPYSNFGSFVFTGTDHTTLLSAAAFPTRTAGTTKLTGFISNLLSGQVTNVGP